MDLSPCGLADGQLRARMQEHQDRNRFSAFLLPLAVNLALLVVAWTSALLPRGMLDSLRHLQHYWTSVSGRAEVSPPLQVASPREDFGDRNKTRPIK